MKKFLFGAVVAAGLALTATPSLACNLLVPSGYDTTYIRRGPAHASAVQDEVRSGYGKLIYCGHSEDDMGGEDYTWLKVRYRINDRNGWQVGWVASSVVSVSVEDDEGG